MSEDLEKLKKIGAQKIYEKTHIARANVENILNKSYDKLPKIQFKGFISILEREYKVDLQDLVKEFEGYSQKEEEIAIATAPKVKKQYIKYDNKTLLSALLIALTIGYLVISSLVHSGSEVIEVNNTEIETAKANLEHNETNETNETNATTLLTDVNETNVTKKQLELNTTQASTAPSIITSSTQNVTQGTKFEIVPSKRLWLSYSELGSSKHGQANTNDTISLDASKEYLLELGHGFVKIGVGSNMKEFHEQNKKYFKYQGGQVSEITRTEFKELNKD
jgi:hypothetical protein